MENEDITSLVPTKYLVALEGHSFSAEVVPAYRPHAYTHSAKSSRYKNALELLLSLKIGLCLELFS